MAENDKTWDVFISYSSQDRNQVGSIVRKLKESGLKVFLDSETIGPGADVTEAIERGLSQSRALVLLFSKNATQSSWMKSELTAFLAHTEQDKRIIIPVLLDHTSPKELPFFLRTRECIRWNDEDMDLSSIIESIGLSEAELAHRIPATTAKMELQKRQVTIENTLEGDFNSFSPEQQRKLLDAIAKLIDTDATEISIKSKKPGSVKYQFSLTPEQAARLFFAINNGEMDELRQFDVKEVRKIDDASRVFIGHGRSPLW